MAIVLGNTYKDKITGFVGVASGHCEYLTGCSQTLLSAKAEGGKAGEAAWYDDQRLTHLTIEPRITLDNGNTPGCDMPAPIR